MQFPLNPDKPLTRGMYSEPTEVAADPFPAKFLCNREGCAGTAEEVGYEITLVGVALRMRSKKCFGFLGGVTSVLIGLRIYR